MREVVENMIEDMNHEAILQSWKIWIMRVVLEASFVGLCLTVF